MEAALNPFQNDRRAHKRRRALAEHGIVLARIRPGDTAALIDVSGAGVLVETNQRLLPGAFVELCLEGKTRRENARGRVLRCAVVALRPAAVRYRAAIHFDSYLPWFVEDDEYVVQWGGTDRQAGSGRTYPAGTVR
jgi:PilZ domain